MEKLKVAMICHVSNEKIRSFLKLKKYSLIQLIKRGDMKVSYKDYSIWHTLVFEEFGKIGDIELHAIIPHPGMKKKMTCFVDNGVYYHCFGQDMEGFPKNLWLRNVDILERYKYNTKMILSIIDQIEPDLINMIGAEGPFLNLSGLHIDTSRYPLVLTLQTAVSDPDFLKYYPFDEKTYKIICKCEQALFKHSNYIASDSTWHRYIAQKYNPGAQFVNYHFCSPQYKIDRTTHKEFDFVYWAANINKAGEDVIEAFGRAIKKDNNLTLNMVGDYTPEYRNYLESKMLEKGINGNVTFSGYFPSHEDALRQVQKSKFALLPIKADVISGTIREAMMLRLPIVTFITHGTPELNKNQETVLLSPIGDYEDMANNMLRLVKDKTLAENLIDGEKKFDNFFFDNYGGVRRIAQMYHSVYNNFHYGTDIPEEIRKAYL